MEDVDGDGEYQSEFDDADGDDLVLKILLTPFAVILDICTSPVQAVMFGWDDDDDDDC